MQHLMPLSGRVDVAERGEVRVQRPDLGWRNVAHLDLVVEGKGAAFSALDRGTLKAYRRESLEGFRLYGEMHRFIPVFAHSVGAKITEVQVNHHPRKFGKSKVGLERTLKVVLDLFTVKFLVSYSSKPIYLFGGAGLALIFGSGAMLAYLGIRRVLTSISVLGSPFFQLSVMLFIMGFQSVLMGLIAELLVRTYYESQRKPTYRIRKTINLPEPNSEK